MRSTEQPPYTTVWSTAGAILALVPHTVAETLAYIHSDRPGYALLPAGACAILAVAVIATSLLLWLLEWGLWMRTRSPRWRALIWCAVALVTFLWIPVASALSLANALGTMLRLPPIWTPFRVGLSVLLAMVVTLGYLAFGRFI